MSTPSIKSIWPFPAGTANKTTVMFPDVDLFSEDDEWARLYQEEEDLVRFNSIAKTAGVVARKIDGVTYLFPQGVSGNQISVSPGVGFTKNGARIVIETALTVIDATALIGYVASLGTSLFLVVRKKVEDYAERSNYETGTLYKTRRRILFDSSVLEWVSSSTVSTDRDIVVLGRRLTNGLFTFDTTEATGKRTLLRTTEYPALETIGGTMSGDIDMQNVYEILRLPSIRDANWKYSGAASKRDLIRVFAKTNYTVSLLGGISFGYSTPNYQLRFEATSEVKIRLSGSQRPPATINLSYNGTVINLPDNNVLQIVLTEKQLLATSSIETQDGSEATFETSQLDVGVIEQGGVTLEVNPFETTNNNYDFHKIPICFHSVFNGVHKLLFADGTILNLNDSIDSNSLLSSYLHTRGDNNMIGNVRIRKADGTVEFVHYNVPDGTSQAGLLWRNVNESVIADFRRITLRNLDASPEGFVEGDVALTLYNSEGSAPKRFIFRQDGRLQQPDAAAVDLYDLMRKIDTDTLLNYKYDKTGGILTGDVSIRKPHPVLNLMHNMESAEIDGPIDSSRPIGEIQWLNPEGAIVGAIRRHRQVRNVSDDGDISIIARDINGGDTSTIWLRRFLKRLDLTNLYVVGTATIDGSLYFKTGNELPTTNEEEISEGQVKLVAPTVPILIPEIGEQTFHPQIFLKAKYNRHQYNAALVNYSEEESTYTPPGDGATVGHGFVTYVYSRSSATPFVGTYLVVVNGNFTRLAGYHGGNIEIDVVRLGGTSILTQPHYITNLHGSVTTDPAKQSFSFTKTVTLDAEEALFVKIRKSAIEAVQGLLKLTYLGIQLVQLR